MGEGAVGVEEEDAAMSEGAAHTIEVGGGEGERGSGTMDRGIRRIRRLIPSITESPTNYQVGKLPS